MHRSNRIFHIPNTWLCCTRCNALARFPSFNRPASQQCFPGGSWDFSQQLQPTHRVGLRCPFPPERDSPNKFITVIMFLYLFDVDLIIKSNESRAPAVKRMSYCFKPEWIYNKCACVWERVRMGVHHREKGFCHFHLIE